MSAPSAPSLVLSFEEARRIVEQQAASVEPRGVETVDLLSADGRVLAESVIADRDIPPFARSTRDGYAVRSSDLAEVPVRLRLIGEIKAGLLHASEKTNRQRLPLNLILRHVELGSDFVHVQYQLGAHPPGGSRRKDRGTRTGHTSL